MTHSGVPTHQHWIVGPRPDALTIAVGKIMKSFEK